MAKEVNTAFQRPTSLIGKITNPYARSTNKQIKTCSSASPL